MINNCITQLQNRMRLNRGIFSFYVFSSITFYANIAGTEDDDSNGIENSSSDEIEEEPLIAVERLSQLPATVTDKMKSNRWQTILEHMYILYDRLEKKVQFLIELFSTIDLEDGFVPRIEFNDTVQEFYRTQKVLTKLITNDTHHLMPALKNISRVDSSNHWSSNDKDKNHHPGT